MEDLFYGFHSQSGRSGIGKLHLLLFLLNLIKSAALHSVYNNTSSYQSYHFLSLVEWIKCLLLIQ